MKSLWIDPLAIAVCNRYLHRRPGSPASSFEYFGENYHATSALLRNALILERYMELVLSSDRATIIRKTISKPWEAESRQ